MAEPRDLKIEALGDRKTGPDKNSCVLTQVDMNCTNRLLLACRDHLEFILPCAIERALGPVLGPPAAYALHLGMKAGRANYDEDAGKFFIVWGHMEFFLLWILGLVAGFLHPALGILLTYALHLAIKALTLYSAMKK